MLFVAVGFDLDLSWTAEGEDVGSITLRITNEATGLRVFETAFQSNSAMVRVDFRVEGNYVFEIDATLQVPWSFTLEDPNYHPGADQPPVLQPPPPPFTFEPGIWRVGTDIPAGTYRNDDSSGGCYWARLRGFSGELSDIIGNGFSYDLQIVTISAFDVGFESARCGTWTEI